MNFSRVLSLLAITLWRVAFPSAPSFFLSCARQISAKVNSLNDCLLLVITYNMFFTYTLHLLFRDIALRGEDEKRAVGDSGCIPHLVDMVSISAGFCVVELTFGCFHRFYPQPVSPLAPK